MKKSHFSRNISRRDFLNGTSIGVGSMLLGVGAPNALSSARRNAPGTSLGQDWYGYGGVGDYALSHGCLLYTSPSPRDLSTSRMPSSA